MVGEVVVVVVVFTLIKLYTQNVDLPLCVTNNANISKIGHRYASPF